MKTNFQIIFFAFCLLPYAKTEAQNTSIGIRNNHLFLYNNDESVESEIFQTALVDKYTSKNIAMDFSLLLGSMSTRQLIIRSGFSVQSQEREIDSPSSIPETYTKNLLIIENYGKRSFLLKVK